MFISCRNKQNNKKDEERFWIQDLQWLWQLSPSDLVEIRRGNKINLIEPMYRSLFLHLCVDSRGQPVVIRFITKCYPPRFRSSVAQNFRVKVAGFLCYEPAFRIIHVLRNFTDHQIQTGDFCTRVKNKRENDVSGLSESTKDFGMVLSCCFGLSVVVRRCDKDTSI